MWTFVPKWAKHDVFGCQERGPRCTVIYILDTGSKNFSERKVLNTDITGNVSTIAHVTGKTCLIIHESDTNKVIGTSDKTGHTLWQLQGVINGAWYIPKTVTHYFTHQTNGVGGAIIVGDGSSKVMVFSSRDGKYKHKINDDHLKSVSKIDCAGEMLIVQQENNGSIEFLLYHIKCDSSHSVRQHNVNNFQWLLLVLTNLWQILMWINENFIFFSLLSENMTFLFVKFEKRPNTKTSSYLSCTDKP